MIYYDIHHHYYHYYYYIHHLQHNLFQFFIHLLNLVVIFYNNFAYQINFIFYQN